MWRGSHDSVPSAIRKALAIWSFITTLWLIKLIHHQVERKRDILKPITPQQIIAEHLQKSSKVKVESEKERMKNNLSAISKTVSEIQMPNLSDKNQRARKNLVMIATKSEMRDVINNPTQVLIVLVYKDTLLPQLDIYS
jgi:hypothetical protein